MRFAYLIMADQRFDVLKELLKDLDDERNDIFLHIDKKTKDYDVDELKGCIRKGRLQFVRPMAVYWGHSSQIQCVLNLLKAATKAAFHDYYHLLVGVEFPIKSQTEIYDFFARNYGKEFIGYDIVDTRYIDRIKYFYFWGKYARSNKKYEQKLYDKCLKFVEWQKKNGINRVKKDGTVYKKGYANWSITDDLARFFVKNESFIRKKMKYTFCADEIFFHTLAYNSGFREKIYDFDDEYNSCMRITTWQNTNNRLCLKDVDRLMKSGKLFARKIDGEDAIDLIYKIKESRDVDKLFGL